MDAGVATLETLQADLADLERRLIGELHLVGHDELLLLARRNELPDTDLVGQWRQLHDVCERLVRGD